MYISGLHFAFQGAAEARYDRFSILTDFVYLDSGGGRSSFREIDTRGQPPLLITPGLQTGFSVTLMSAVWTQTGGYTVLAGDWGNLDLFAGFRLLTLSIKTNYGLSATITGPFGNSGGLGRFGSLSTCTDIWNGIAGLRGRIRLGDTDFFIPYYVDIGGGGSRPTWQIASGVGYQWGRVGLSATYRYLSFQQPGGAGDAHISMRGPMLMGTIRF